MDSRPGRPSFLPHRVRLSAHSDRIRTRTQLRDGFERVAVVGGGPPLAQAGGGSDRDLPARGRGFRTVRVVEVDRHESNVEAGSDVSERAAPRGGRAHVLREHAPGSERDSWITGSDRPTRSQLLHPVPRTAEDGCGAGPGKDYQG